MELFLFLFISESSGKQIILIKWFIQNNVVLSLIYWRLYENLYLSLTWYLHMCFYFRFIAFFDVTCKCLSDKKLNTSLSSNNVLTSIYVSLALYLWGKECSEIISFEMWNWVTMQCWYLSPYLVCMYGFNYSHMYMYVRENQVSWFLSIS